MLEIERIFTCRRCGFCCHGETTVSLDENDQRQMVQCLNLHREQVKSKYWRVTGTTVQMQTVDGHCIFMIRDASSMPDVPGDAGNGPSILQSSMMN